MTALWVVVGAVLGFVLGFLCASWIVTDEAYRRYMRNRKDLGP